MIERPILFSGPMVCALLDGSKTQTRRVAKVRNELPPAWATVASEGHSLSQDAGPCPTGCFFWSEDQTPGMPLKSLRRWPVLPAKHPMAGDWYWTPSPYGVIGDRLLVAMEIPSAPNRDYCAGSDGQIYSRTRYAGFGRKERTDWYPLIGHADKRKGYRRVSLCHENKKVTRSVHSLVCEAFYGPPPFAGAQVRHLDGDQENNAPFNLCWGTQEQNWADRRVHGNGIAGEKHHAAKLTDEERDHLRWAVEQGLCSQRHAARVLGMAQGSICQIMKASELVDTMVDIPAYRIPRITLEVTGVRVERLQDISRGDAMDEGCPFPNMAAGDDPRQWFSGLWSQINGVESWAANPWVWVIEFKRVVPAAA